MAIFSLPKINDIAQTMTLFLSQNTDIDETEQLMTTADDQLYVFEYLDDTDQPVAASVCELRFIANAGAAMTMVPAGIAEEAIQTNEVTTTMSDNAYELMNMVSRYLIDSTSPHLRIGKMYKKTELPVTVKTVLEQAAKQRTFSVTVPNYGQGSFQISVT